MEGKFPSKTLVFVTVITHTCDSFFCWSQIFHILPSICEGFILPSQIRFFERAFWIRQKFLVANRHFSCSDESAGVVPTLHEALNQGFEVHYDAFRVACSGCRGVWNQVGIAVLT